MLVENDQISRKRSEISKIITITLFTEQMILVFIIG